MSNQQLDILFVDDEQRILDGLRRQLRTRRQNWQMRFAASGEEALKLLGERPADIVVSDMRMPGMSGGQLLQRVLREFPQTTRIILSGQTDQADLLRDLGCIHQYIQKPCESAQLCSSIERTFALASRIQQPQLRLAINRVTALPPASSTYHELLAELTKEDGSVLAVAEIVSRDPALTVKLMQLVNSAFFGMPRKVSTPREAVVLLGLKTLHSIIVAGRLFEYLGKENGANPELVGLWERSFRLSDLSSKFANEDGADSHARHNARMAGLLSLIGRAILLTSDPGRYSHVLKSAAENRQSVSQSEVEIFGATQEDVTAYALGLWAFPDEIVEAVAYQEKPSRLQPCRKHHAVGYLHLARHVAQSGSNHVEPDMVLDVPFATQQGLMKFVPELTTAA